MVKLANLCNSERFKEFKFMTNGIFLAIRDYLCFQNKIEKINEIKYEYNETFYEFLNNINLIYQGLPASSNEKDITQYLVRKDVNKIVVKVGNFLIFYRINLELIYHAIKFNKSFEPASLFIGHLLCAEYINFDKFWNLNETLENATCKQYFKAVVTPMRILYPYIFGKLYYSPKSQMHKDIMKKVNETFVALEKLKGILYEWNHHFKDSIIEKLIISTQFKSWKEVAQNCFQYLNNINLCNHMKYFFTDKGLKTVLNVYTRLTKKLEDMLNCVDLDRFIVTDKINKSIKYEDIFAFIEFSGKSNKLLDYTIRLPSERFFTMDKNEFIVDSFKVTKTQIFLKYYRNGFLFLQNAIDSAFINLKSNQNVDIGGSLQFMPYLCFSKHNILQFDIFIVLILIVTWITPFYVFIFFIVYEKEKYLKEFMKVMGVNTTLHWLCWFIPQFLYYLILSLIAAISLYCFKIFQTNIGFLFLIFLSYSISLICQTFLITIFFSKANTASIFSSLVYFIIFMPFVALNSVGMHTSSISWYFSFFFCQSCFSKIISMMVILESQNVFVSFGSVFEYKYFYNPDLRIVYLIIMFYVDALIYMLLTLYIEEVFPGEFGVGRKWYFLCTPTFWKDSLKNQNIEFVSEIQKDKSYFEDVTIDLKKAIVIKDLTKYFATSKTVAVNKLTMDFYNSQITSFLGHNGAGKSTTISILTGFYKPTSGNFYIGDYDGCTQMDQIRESLGYCPQHNVLWDSLTVQAHIYIFGLLKRIPFKNIMESMDQILTDMELLDKKTTLVSHLSGGMKRKLSIAIAFLGDSKVVILDEPTAGIDPEARFNIWQFIISKKQSDRCIILTTHHMDEADYLSDRVAIMSQGQLKCCGTTLFLKNVFGGGYYLNISKQVIVSGNSDSSETEKDSTKLLKYVKSICPKAKLNEESRYDLTIIVPKEDKNIPTLLNRLDANKNSLNIESYGISDATLEQVFINATVDPALQVLKDAELELKIDHDVVYVKGLPLYWTQFVGLFWKRFHCLRHNMTSLLSQIIFPLCFIFVVMMLISATRRSKNEKKVLIHPWLMLHPTMKVPLKTFYSIHQNTNLTNQLTQLYTSNIGEAGVRCLPSKPLSGYSCYPDLVTKWTEVPENIIFNSSSCDCMLSDFSVCQDQIKSYSKPAFKTMASTDKILNLTKFNLHDYFLKFYYKNRLELYGGFEYLFDSTFSLSSSLFSSMSMLNDLENFVKDSRDQKFVRQLRDYFNMTGNVKSYIRIWININGLIAEPAYNNIKNNLLLRYFLKNGGIKNINEYGILTSTHPIPIHSNKAENPFEFMNDLCVSLLFTMCITIISSSFVIFVIEERITASKQLQYLAGLRPFIYWLSNFVFDYLKFLLSFLVILIILFAFNYYTFICWMNIGAFISIILLFGLAIIPFIYILSFMFKVGGSGFVGLSTFFTIIIVVSYIAFFAFKILIAIFPNNYKYVKHIKHALFFIPPVTCSHAMFSIVMKDFPLSSLLDKNKTGEKQSTFSLLHKEILTFICLTIIYFIILFIIDLNLIRYITKYFNSFYKIDKINRAEDENTEFNRINEINANEFTLKAVDVGKVYGIFKKQTAIVSLSFGVNKGECFGLLGKNGAGKSTLFKIFTGETMITKGDVWIYGLSINDEIFDVYENVGFCPQFDALHLYMTCKEEMSLYCKLRGISDGKMLNDIINNSLTSMGLTGHTNKEVRFLSGGNKRKLSAAVALIGNPDLLLLDEPTAGMDAGARRFLWDRIRHLLDQQGPDGNYKTVILTSHNMEECEVLCNRIIIMVDGLIKAIGSIQNLKNKFSNCYHVRVALDPHHDSANATELIRNMLTERFNDVDNFEMIQSDRINNLHFIMNESLKLSYIFQVFEDMKTLGNIEEYSIQQNTLNDLFLKLVASITEVNSNT